MIGEGGHSRVCVEALLDTAGTAVVACVSSDGTDIEELLRRHDATHVFVAIGDNAARSHLLQRCLDTDTPLTNAVSRFAMVSRGATLGLGVALLPGAVVNTSTTLHHGVIVNTNSSIDHDCTVGSGTHVAPGATVAGGVAIGSGVLVGIGARILPGLHIGDGATIGAGSVVTRNVDEGVTVVGIPAGELPHGHR